MWRFGLTSTAIQDDGRPVYTAAADPIYGDPAVCAPPVIQHVDDELRNDHGHCGRDYREQVLCDVKLVKP